MNSSPRRANPWPCSIIAFFAVLVASLAAFVVFAARNRMELVRPDYYEEEIRFQEQLDRLNRTRALHAEVEIAYDPAPGEITIVLPRAHLSRSVSGRIELYRPSDASLDRTLPLTVDADGRQRVDAKRLRAGLWKVRVLWSTERQEFFFDRSIVVGSNPS